MPPPTGVVTARFLNLRPAPDTRRPPLGRLPRGTRLRLLEHIGRWYRVASERGDGFVHGDFVAVVEEQPAAGFLREDPELAAVPLAPPAPLAPAAAAGAAGRAVARTWNAWGGLIGAVAERLALPPGAPLAMVLVESAGRAFARDGRLVVRFEPHVFWRTWGREHPAAFAELFRFDPVRPWQGHGFRADPGALWQPVHRSQESEWAALERARRCDDHRALLATSMGAPQIMGFNHHRVGYASPRAMLDAFASGVRPQLLALFDFVKGAGTTSALLEALRRLAFPEVAALYNGPGRAAEYAARLEAAFEGFDQLATA